MDMPEVNPNIPPINPPSGVEMNAEARNWGMFCHLAGFAGYVVPIPGANILGPLVVWQMKKDQIPFVDFCGKEALNFQITLFIALVVSAVLCIALIGFLLLPVVLVYGVVMKILAAIKAANGEYYRYPLTLRFVT